MTDLGYSKENYTCIIIQDVFDRLDCGTALRYRNKIDIQRSLGSSVEEDLDSICLFLRSEATTLEMTIGVSTISVNSIDNLDTGVVETCDIGCDSNHPILDCNAYIEMDPLRRRSIIKSSQRCFLCLEKGHKKDTCTIPSSCSCDDKHHISLCTIARGDLSVSNNCVATPEIKTGNVKPRDYSPLVVAEICNGNGEWTRAKCFLDVGSNQSLIRTDFAVENNILSGEEGNVHLGVAGGHVHTEPSEIYGFHIRPIGGEESYYIEPCGISKPCADIRPVPTSVFHTYKHLKPVKEKVYLDGGAVDILVGRDYAPLIREESALRAMEDPDNNPSVEFTRLGCYISGGLTKSGEGTVNNRINVNFISKHEESELQRFLYSDIIGVQPTSLCVCTDNEISESNFIKHVHETTTMSDEGRVKVEMPWARGFPKLLPKPNNFYRAKDQLLRRETNLKRDEELWSIHNNEIQKLVDLGAVKKLSIKESQKAIEEEGWFLNHRIVVQPGKSTTKHRLVFDSAAPYKGFSLNDGYHKGPSLTNPMFKCQLKWREDYVAATGDIEKMFNQVGIAEKDQKYHQFLWRNGDSEAPIIVYQWQRLVFGNKPSPDLATYALHYLAEKERPVNPKGAHILEKEAYVDDIGFSRDNALSTSEGISQVNNILGNGKFNIKIWNSNSLDLDQNHKEVTIDVLGYRWNKRDDTFYAKIRNPVEVSEEVMSKKWTLGFVARVCWDPLGMYLPVTIQYRIDLQTLWAKGFGWNQVLPKDFAEVWIAHMKEVQEFQTVSLDRCLKPPNVIEAPQLHAFSDGGDDAFGTCIFIRWVTTEGVQLRFVAAKAFVAPLKRKSIPKVELMGVIAMSRLTTEIVDALGLTFMFIRFWIDSEVVLYWLFSESCLYKPFVSTRVQEFQDNHSDWKKELRYVPSEDNSADCLTKSIPIENLQEWLSGNHSSFLKDEVTVWDKEVDPNSLNEDEIKDDLEIKKSCKTWSKTCASRSWTEESCQCNLHSREGFR